MLTHISTQDRLPSEASVALMTPFSIGWTSTCTVLLPKKGDLNLLQNWRPISLINTDAKKGFMPQRFIGDNGLMMQLAKIEAEQKQSAEICLLLDQEKAYDRVHPEYLRKVMLQFGFPPSLVSTIYDFQRFCVRYDEYAQASNAKLNLGKTEAFSLSGCPNPTWQYFLSTQGITTWHDHNSTSAIRYLGFPIYSSIARRNAFVNELTLKIQRACALQSQRNLSFRGRVTVMNTLIYSKLWYVLRLLSVPQPDLQKFASIGYQFVTQSVFPKFKQEFLFVDRQVGGLKLLNPSKQQLVLQWKWLRPLLLSHNSRSVSTIIHYLTYSIQHHFDAIDPLLPLLFLLRRKGPLGKTNELNIFTNLFRTMDALDKSYQHIQLSPATCLQLPLSSIHRFDNPLPEHAAAGPNTPNGPSSPIARLSLRSWSKIQVSDVFFFDSHRGCLRKKRRTDIDPFPFLISRFFKALEKKRYLARTFFSAQLCDTSQLYTLYPDGYDRLRSICRWLGTTRSFLCQNVHCSLTVRTITTLFITRF
ncbi:hypothetical protein G6F17_011598 [Rhizopus arrhizus]|nr:hypothetical protein G6F17_011598 [Rhizopus arrhizus]